MPPRIDPIDRTEQATLRKARLQTAAGPSLSLPLAGPAAGSSAGLPDSTGTWRGVSLCDVDSADAFYTAG